MSGRRSIGSIGQRWSKPDEQERSKGGRKESHAKIMTGRATISQGR